MDTFDVNDKNSWYFGSMSRQDATEVLMNERERGVFLVRDSNSIAGDYVLCVREDTKVGNYIINKIQQNDQIVYRIGDQSFENLSKLLTFYTLHYLDTTPLRKPAPKKVERVVGKFDFDGSDQDDLPFKRGEILTIVRKDEDQWWTAKNCLGQIGQIPVPYVQKYDESIEENLLERPSSGSSSNCGSSNSIIRQPRVSSGGTDIVQTASSLHQLSNTLKKSDLNYDESIEENLLERPSSGSSSNCGSSNSIIRQPRVSSGGTDIVQTASSLHQLSNTLKKSDLNRKLPAFARVKQARVPNAYDKTALKLEIGDIIKVTKTNINGQWEGEHKGKKGHFPFTHVEFIEETDFNKDSAAHPKSQLVEGHTINSTDWGE